MRTLRQLVWHSLDLDMLDSAEFAAERLVAEDYTAAHVYLLGLVHFRQRRFKTCMAETSKFFGSDPSCLYLYAKACLSLGLHEAGLSALEASRKLWQLGPVSARPAGEQDRAMPDRLAFLTVRGRLQLGARDLRAAVKSFGAAARINPFFWDAVEALAHLGVPLNLDNLYRPSLLDSARDKAEAVPVGSAPLSRHDDPFLAPSGPSGPSSGAVSFTFKTGQNYLSTRTTDVQSTPTAGPSSAGQSQDSFNTPSAPLGRLAGQGALPLAPQKRNLRNISTNTAPFDSQRRPVRTGKRSGLGVAASSGSGSVSGSTRPSVLFQPPKQTGKALTAQSEAEELCDIYKPIAQGCISLHRYDGPAALESFMTLPAKHRDTPYVLACLGRVHFEETNYRQSVTAFARVRELDRFRLQDMDVYSTALWQLRKTVDLGFLAHELLSVDRTSSQAWCALGNAFSLQRDPEQAIKCFQRAVKLNPTCPYAYTLQAHEHINSDALELAQGLFRQALSQDNRCYTAWYGLGMVFMRQANIDDAELHFAHALSISPRNVVLICCMGTILEKRGLYKEALERYTRACEIQPQSAVSIYKKARVLMTLKLYQAALTEFDRLKVLGPDEANVHFLLGQLYRALQNRELALKHFTIAMNLDPRGSQLIKEAMV